MAKSVEFRQCIEKLYSSIVVLRQYFSRLDQQETSETCIDDDDEEEESEKKFRVSIMTIYSL